MPVRHGTIGLRRYSVILKWGVDMWILDSDGDMVNLDKVDRINFDNHLLKITFMVITGHDEDLEPVYDDVAQLVYDSVEEVNKAKSFLIVNLGGVDTRKLRIPKE